MYVKMDPAIKMELDVLENSQEVIEIPDEESLTTFYITMEETKNTTKQPKKARSRTKTVKKEKQTKKIKTVKNCDAEILEKQELSTRFKKRFLEFFRQEGCTPETVEKYAKLCNVRIGDIYEFFNEEATKAQCYVNQECESLSFSNITEWLEYLQATGAADQCDYEAAIAMNGIVNNERHCDPNEIEGIDLNEIYKFITNALMGLPQNPLDEASAKFLSHEFQNLINEANTDEADSDVVEMKGRIEYYIKNGGKSQFPSLDPLNTVNERLNASTMINVKKQYD